MPSTCGMTSPARWIVTVSPMRTSSRAISSALCSVAFCTMTPPTPPDLNLDVLDDGRSLLGREFVRDRPARRTGDEAEPLLPVEPVDLIDDAVDVVVERGALLANFLVEREQLLRRFADLPDRRRVE